MTAVLVWDSGGAGETEMNERGFSPGLAVFSVAVVLFFLCCPRVFFSLVGTIFSVVFVIGLHVMLVALIAFSAYCLYVLIRGFGGRR
jgi:hypothetical protein